MGDQEENGGWRAASGIFRAIVSTTTRPPTCVIEHFEVSRIPKRFERSKAIEQLERLERTNPRDERSRAVERLESLERDPFW